MIPPLVFNSSFNNSTARAVISQIPTIDQKIAVAFITNLQWASFGIFLGGLGLAIMGMAYWIRTFRGDTIAVTKPRKNVEKVQRK